MHKEEASKLFECLGDPCRVKLVKVLYHNTSLSFSDLLERIGLESIELKSHVRILLENQLIINQENMFSCNKNLVDNLMNFISTRCGCCS